jgi:hypothetical protein
MSGHLIVGVWFGLCGLFGMWRAIRQLRRDPETMLWQVEAALSVMALGIGCIFTLHAIASSGLK